MADHALLAVTDTALARIRGFRAASPEFADAALAVAVTGVAGDEYTVALSLEPRLLPRPEDRVEQLGDLVIVVAGDSVERVRGATVDWSDDPPSGGFRVLNPNKPPLPRTLPLLPILPMSSASGPPAGPAGPGAPLDAQLDSELARRVMAVLDEDVNPNIAAHGGHAELAGVDGDTAYLRLGGGCQGCGMASVTLTQGIEVAIMQAVPEIVAVVDVTDHASGTNPFFEAAKK
jgi:Fe/S biogenesis protein NfuA